MSSTSNITPYYPIIESLTENITISHLYSLDIRNIIGEEGIKKVCDPMHLFRQVFNNPYEFNKIFLNGSMVISGICIIEYIYTGKIDISRNTAQCIDLHVNRRYLGVFNDYLRMNEHNEDNTLEYSSYRYQSHLLESGIRVRVHIHEHNVRDEVQRHCSMPKITKDNIEMNHTLFVPGKRWYSYEMEYIEFGIPKLDVYKLISRLRPTIHIIFPVYLHNKGMEYEAFSESTADARNSQRCISNSIFIRYNILILSCGKIDDVIYPVFNNSFLQQITSSHGSEIIFF